MTKPATHTVEGARGVRKSPRNYTHAVVVTVDHAWVAANVMPRRIAGARANAVDNYGFDRKLAEGMTHGTFRSGERFPYGEQTINEAKALVAKFPTAESYADHTEALVRARYADDAAKTGDHDRVVSWHQSLAAAQREASKVAASGMYKAVRVSETIRAE